MANPVAFTADGEIQPTEAATTDGLQEVCGLSFTTFTAVDLYDGDPATTGVLVAHCGAPGLYPFGTPIRCRHGVYVDVTGSGGKGSVWIA